MFLINVIPLSRGIGSESLSYFSKHSLTPGTLVQVELRTRMISALVVSSKPAEVEKTSIKSALFSLKKISSVSKDRLIRDEAIEAASEAAQYFCATTGAVLNHLISKTILEHAKTFSEKPLTATLPSPHPAKLRGLQTDDDDRIAHYKRIIRESFARKTSVFLSVPTIHDASRMRILLSKGIEEYTVTLHGSLSKKNLVESWEQAYTISHPVLIIGTGTFLTVPRDDIKTIIVEREHASGYRIQSRPFLDYRVFIELYAKKIGATVIFGDNLLRVETLWRIEEGLVHELAPLTFRSLNKPRQTLIDMRTYSKHGGGTFAVFSSELIEELKNAHRELRKVILFATRRGLATETVCGDCGSIVRCSSCHAPVVLHQSSSAGGNNFFMCHRCGERRSAHERCTTCTSWKLVPLGIGTERVEEELKRLVPELPRFRLDTDTATTPAMAKKIVKNFTKAPFGVLVGTEALLHHELELADVCAVVSLDALFAIPDFRIHEKIVHLILELRSLTKGPFLLQTRNPDEEILSDAITGHLANFFRREVEVRKKFLYPPFSILLKVTVEGNKNSITAIMNQFQNDILPRTISIFPAYVKSGRTGHALHGLIKIPRAEWIDTPLAHTLARLPPQVSINVNPESVL